MGMMPPRWPGSLSLGCAEPASRSGDPAPRGGRAYQGAGTRVFTPADHNGPDARWRARRGVPTDVGRGHTWLLRCSAVAAAVSAAGQNAGRLSAACQDGSRPPVGCWGQDHFGPVAYRAAEPQSTAAGVGTTTLAHPEFGRFATPVRHNAPPIPPSMPVAPVETPGNARSSYPSTDTRAHMATSPSPPIPSWATSGGREFSKVGDGGGGRAAHRARPAPSPPPPAVPFIAPERLKMTYRATSPSARSVSVVSSQRPLCSLPRRTQRP